MNDVFLCDGIRTPIGRYGGALSSVRADDLAAIPLRALVERNPGVDWAAVDDVYYGCANQAGEDNRNVARMALLLAGLPTDVPAATVNRLCGSSMEAIAICARTIAAGEADLMIAGGVESMTRAPFVMPKADSAFARANAVYDTTIGWRFVNPLMKKQYGIDSMPETAENVAADFGIARADQDAFALRSQQRYFAAQARGFFAGEIAPVTVPGRKGDTVVAEDEHPRETTLEALAKLKPIVKPDGTVTAGNASGVNDGAVATLIASARRGREARAEADRPHPWRGHGRRAAADHGHRAGARLGETAGAARTEGRGHRRDRTERSLRRAGPGGHPPARPAGRRRAREPERRRDRAGSPARRFRGEDHADRHAPAGRHRRPLRARHHVHRRRAGHCPAC